MPIERLKRVNKHIQIQIQKEMERIMVVKCPGEW
jgi:hypothetical protein